MPVSHTKPVVVLVRKGIPFLSIRGSRSIRHTHIRGKRETPNATYRETFPTSTDQVWRPAKRACPGLLDTRSLSPRTRGGETGCSTRTPQHPADDEKKRTVDRTTAVGVDQSASRRRHAIPCWSEIDTLPIGSSGDLALSSWIMLFGHSRGRGDLRSSGALTSQPWEFFWFDPINQRSIDSGRDPLLTISSMPDPGSWQNPPNFPSMTFEFFSASTYLAIVHHVFSIIATDTAATHVLSVTRAGALPVDHEI